MKDVHKTGICFSIWLGTVEAVYEKLLSSDAMKYSKKLDFLLMDILILKIAFGEALTRKLSLLNGMYQKKSRITRHIQR